jgi:DNA polymerase I
MTSTPGVPAVVGEPGIFPLFGDPGITYAIGRQHAIDQLREILREGKDIALDTESFGLGRDGYDLKCVQIANSRLVAVLDPRDPVQHDVIKKAVAWVRRIRMHNSPHDFPILIRNGLATVDDAFKVVDSLIYARLAIPDEHTSKNLGMCAARYLGTSSDDTLFRAFRALGMSRKDGFYQFDLDRPTYVINAALDGLLTFWLTDKTRAAALDTLTKDHPFTSVGVSGEEALELREREQVINRRALWRSGKGFRVDFEHLDRYRTDTHAKRIEAETKLEELSIKPGRASDLVKFLDDQGALPARYPVTPKGKKPSTVAKHLERLKHPVAQLYVDHKRIEKIEKDYLVKVVDMADENGWVHPQLNILAAATGRMSAGNPPYQQFIGAARGIILADPGDQMTSIDWSQIEPVVAANMAHDVGPALLGYEDGSSDMYEGIATLAGIARKQAKVSLLAQLYGEGLAKLATDLEISQDEAAAIRQAVFRAMPQTALMIARIKSYSKRYAKVFTLSGRIVHVPVYRGEVAAYKGVNYTVQGSAYDMLADSAYRIEKAGLGEAIYLYMHDELVVSTAAAHDIRKIMETPPERLCMIAKRTPVLRTDLKDLGERWAEA